MNFLPENTFIPDCPTVSAPADCTLTTACFCVYNNNQNSFSLEEIQRKSDTVLRIPCYLVIYGDSQTIPYLRAKREEYGYKNMTKYVETELSKLWTYQYIEKVLENRQKYWPTADPRAQEDSHLINCNKFDFVLKVIEENPFQTSKFGWIDCFLHENGTKICEDYSEEMMVKILNNINDQYHIQVLNVTDKKYKDPKNKKEYYMNYRWVMCGSFFTCGKEIGIKVLNRLKENFVKTTEQGYGHGDELLYLEILDEFYDDIYRSYGDYGQILNNWIAPTKNLHYIYWFILKNYMNFKYYKEAYDCAKILISQIDQKELRTSCELTMNILIDYYMAAYFYKPHECKYIAEKIQHLNYTNADFKREYVKHEDHYNFVLQLHI